MLFQMDEAAFELPGGGWDDQTLNILATPAPDGTHFGVVVNRSALKPGESLVAFADKHQKEHAQKLPAYELLGRRDSVIAGLPAVEAKLQWLHETRVVFHHVVYLSYYEKVLVITGSSLVKYSAECEAMMGEILSTLRFRER